MSTMLLKIDSAFLPKTESEAPEPVKRLIERENVAANPTAANTVSLGNQTTTANTATPPRESAKRGLFMTAEEWANYSEVTNTNSIITGTAQNAIIEVGSKNLILGPEKALKTTFTMRWKMGDATGETVFPTLPVMSPRRVLYLHGELSKRQLKSRVMAAGAGLPKPGTSFIQGRDINAHLINKAGQKIIEDIIKQYLPYGGDLILDPYQSLIAGYEENDSIPAGIAMKFIDYLIETYNLTVYICIHEGKDRRRGARGHSSLAGWRDTLIKLEIKSEKPKTIQVTVQPRWGEAPEPFNVVFSAGTVQLSGGTVPKGQTKTIREFVQAQGGTAKKADIAKLLLGKDGKPLTSDALRKALERAGVVVKGEEVTLPELGQNQEVDTPDTP